jgi:hypothetical protein
LERTGALALKTVADPSAKREFRIPKATLSDVEATVELSESGLLAAINTSAAGRGDDLLLAVAKFAGVAAGFWTGPPLAGLTFATVKDQNLGGQLKPAAVLGVHRGQAIALIHWAVSPRVLPARRIACSLRRTPQLWRVLSDN